MKTVETNNNNKEVEVEVKEVEKETQIENVKRVEEKNETPHFEFIIKKQQEQIDTLTSKINSLKESKLESLEEEVKEVKYKFEDKDGWNV